MYLFNKITVNPQLPKRINRLTDISNNLWWSWNTEFIRIFKEINIDLWERMGRNPVKFLKNVKQEDLVRACEDAELLEEYDRLVEYFDGYMNSKITWFSKNYPNNKGDLIAYFSAEFGLDEILPIYSGGLGILSGDHCKSASDLGIPFTAVGLLYKNGYFHQEINKHGDQETHFKNVDVDNLPILPVKTEDNKDLIISIDFLNRKLHIKVWKIAVGRINLYLMDTDIKENTEEDRKITLSLYGGDQEMRIQQEIVLGMAGVKVLKQLGLNPTVYHMNEGHSSFATLELIKNIMNEKQVSFEIAKEIVTSRTVFTTHTPVPAGNDIFPIDLMEKYFKNFWEGIGLSKEEFLSLGMKTSAQDPGFNMGILALKIAGKKNGVSKLHGAVSRELFGDVWPNIAANESPITYVTNGIHTCTWLAPKLKELFNEYLPPYWQDNMHKDETWENIENIPDEKLWEVHKERKMKLLKLVTDSVTTSMKDNNESYDTISEIVSKLNPNALTIGFARRFATYKRATLIFKDLERITKILNDPEKPVQLLFAGKAHPRDKEGQDLIRYIYEISRMPQFKGKVFMLENYNMALSRLLISGVDVWLNNPRRPLEASGTSGQKASVNGVLNFSILDGWWAEGYNMKNGWAIGTNAEFDSYEEQDLADSQSIYNILENKIIPTYYRIEDNHTSHNWVKIMKNSIKSTGGRFGTARMLTDYVDKLYMPLINVTNKYFTDIDTVSNFNKWKKDIRANWDKIKIVQKSDISNISIDAGNTIDVSCEIIPGKISIDSIETEVYYGKITENGTVEDINITAMNFIKTDESGKTYMYEAKIELDSGGEYGYTFRVRPKNEMLLDYQNLDVIKWITE